mgnify:FL=1
MADRIDSIDYIDFDDFWEEVQAYADQYNLSYAFVEEEFIIDGVFWPVHLIMEDDHCFDFDER